MKHRLLPLALVLLLAGLLALAFRDFVREAIVLPIAYAAWVVSLLLESLPQIIPWMIFLAIGLVIALGSLIARPKPARAAGGGAPHPRGPVEALARQIDLAAQGYYFRWHLARRLRNLAVDTIAYRRRSTPEQVKQQLDAGTLSLPPAIRAYLEAELAFGPVSRFADLLRRVRPGAPAFASPLDLDPAEVVRFLEAQVEVQRDSDDR